MARCAGPGPVPVERANSTADSCGACLLGRRDLTNGKLTFAYRQGGAPCSTSLEQRGTNIADPVRPPMTLHLPNLFTQVPRASIIEANLSTSSPVLGYWKVRLFDAPLPLRARTLWLVHCLLTLCAAPLLRGVCGVWNGL
jgi:hypothetical protein